jgi:hypothetical protein
MARFTELTMQMKADPDVRMIVQNWCVRLNVPDHNVGLLAQRHPKEFDLMTASVDALLEQAPTEMESRWA